MPGELRPDLTFIGRNGAPLLQPGPGDAMIGDLTATFEVRWAVGHH
jgi:hypothetical protein